MGIYDTYGKPNDENYQVQLKVGGVNMSLYKIGDYVPLKDGVYVGNEGIVCIYEDRLVGIVHSIFDKWGFLIQNNQIAEPEQEKK